MSKKIVFTEEQIDNVISLYKSGLGIPSIVNQTGFDKGVVERLLKSKITMRTKGEAQRTCMGIKYVRSEAFDILTPEALYWIGFMYADGFIESKTCVLGISISETDKDHVEKFNQFLGGGLNVSRIVAKGISGLKGHLENNTVLARVKVADRRLYDRLVFLGFTSTKSYDAVPHELLKYSRDFWRGAVDGDGWLYLINEKGRELRPSIGLSGTEDTVVDFVKFLEISGLKINYTPRKRDRSDVWEIGIHGEIGKKVSEVLYKDSTVYLDRKYQKYQEFFNNKS